MLSATFFCSVRHTDETRVHGCGQRAFIRRHERFWRRLWALLRHNTNPGPIFARVHWSDGENHRRKGYRPVPLFIRRNPSMVRPNCLQAAQPIRQAHAVRSFFPPIRSVVCSKMKPIVALISAKTREHRRPSSKVLAARCLAITKKCRVRNGKVVKVKRSGTARAWAIQPLLSGLNTGVAT
jgi:hypothetical protein